MEGWRRDGVRRKNMDIERLVRGRIDVGIARFNDRSSLERDVILDPAIFDVSAAQRSASLWDKKNCPMTTE